MSEAQKPENKKMRNSDLITNLPEEILHQCLSFLGTKDAIQTSVLSKEWNSIWRSFPILDFDQVAFEMNPIWRSLPIHGVNNSSWLEELREMFLNYLSSFIQRRRPMNVKLQRFRLVADLRGLQSDGRINTALKFAVESGVQSLELSLPTNKNQFSIPPESIYIAKSVTVMKLTNLVVNIDDLLKGCPLMEELRLQQCQLPQDIKVLSAKLKNFEVSKCLGVKSVTLEAVNLQSFTYCGIFVEPCRISITACRALKTLSIMRTLVPSQWLEDVLSKLRLLETLEFDTSDELKSLRVYHRRLRSLKLYAYGKVREFAIAIDTPKLRDFVYHGVLVPFEYFNSSGIVDATLYLTELSYPSITLQFATLRKLLLHFGHCKFLGLIDIRAKDIIFSKEMREIYVAPLLDLKHLTVLLSCDESVSYSELVDSFLWQSPHLETLSIASGNKQICLRFEYHEDGENEEMFCCETYRGDCWKHYLKNVIVEYFHGNSDDNKEDLFTFFRRNTNALELIYDVSSILGTPNI